MKSRPWLIIKVLSSSFQKVGLDRRRESKSPYSLYLLHELLKTDESADSGKRFLSVCERWPCDLLSHFRSTIIRRNEVKR